MGLRELRRASHGGARCRSGRATALAFVLLAVSAWRSRSEPERRDDGPGRAEAVSASKENGARLYRERCASCHGPDGRSEGTPALPVPVLAQPDVFDSAGDDYYRRLLAGGHAGTAVTPGAEGERRMSRAEIDDLVAFLWGWAAPGARWEDVRGAEGDPGRGGELYAGLCAGCHGASGQGGIGSRLDAPSFLAAASDELLAATIVRGRPGTAMRAWSQLEAAAVADLIAFLRSLAPDAPAALPGIPLGGGDAEAGRVAYEETCATCHGADGNEVLTAQLSNPAFLRAASDEFLAATIARGREGTDMPAHLDPADLLLPAERVRDVIAFLRRWQEPPTWRAPVRGVEISEQTVAAGARHFVRFCGSCHGPDGKGRKDGVSGSSGFGPALVDPNFLAAASDGFLLATIASGRSATPMRPFGLQAGGSVELPPAVIAEIVAWLRSQEKAGQAEGR